MIILESHKVNKEVENIRVSDYLPGKFSLIPTRKGIKKAIQKGQVLLNGERASTGDWVKKDDLVQLLDIQSHAPKEYKMDLEIVYEDDYLAVINKPAGIPVSGNQFRTIQNALIGNIKASQQTDKLAWPKPVHRLDSATSGLLIVAKSYKTMNRLGEMFAQKEIKKSYHAIVIGKTNDSQTIETKIEDQDALTHFKLIRSVPSLRNEYLSLLKIQLETGRTHQIRIHLSSISHPIFGDKLYGDEGEIYKGKGLFLASTELNFSHPITDERVHVSIDIPHKFESLMKRENRRYVNKLEK